MSVPPDRDQAAGLRHSLTRTCKGLQLPALAVTGGKGGVGKTVVAVNLTVLLARMGLRPLLVDCDLGLANGDVLLGLNPRLTLFDVITGEATLEQALIHHPLGFSFLPAASGRDEMTRLGTRGLADLLGRLACAGTDHDLLVLDTAAGIHAEVMALLKASRTILVVMTPDPTSLTDAYALIKVLEQQAPGKDIRVLVNQAGSDDEATACFTRLRKVTCSYLKREVAFLGAVPRDRVVSQSIRERQPFVTHADALATRALKSAALRLKGERWKDPPSESGPS